MKKTLCAVLLAWCLGTVSSVFAEEVAATDASEPSANETATDDGLIASFDWLIATNGRGEFVEPLLTLNEEDLVRFVATGETAHNFVLGPLVIEQRKGIYFSSDKFPDTSVDQPASVIIRDKDRILAGAKGLFFSIDVTGEFIKIEHWNGEIGCSLARWYLHFIFIDDKLTPQLEVIDSEYADLVSRKRCKPS